MTQPVEMTYSSLVTSIRVYLQRVSDIEFDNFIPQFISLGEKRLAAVFKNLGQLEYVIPENVTSVMQKPPQWRCTRSFRIKNLDTGVTTTLLERGYEFIRQYDAEIDTATEDYNELGPLYYSDYDFSNFYVAHVNPSLNLQAEIGYYLQPLALSELNQTNWWTQYAPQCLLYAALAEAMIMLRSTTEDIGNIVKLFQTSVSDISKEDAQRVYDWSLSLKGSTT